MYGLFVFKDSAICSQIEMKHIESDYNYKNQDQTVEIKGNI